MIAGEFKRFQAILDDCVKGFEQFSNMKKNLLRLKKINERDSDRS